MVFRELSFADKIQQIFMVLRGLPEPQNIGNIYMSFLMGRIELISIILIELALADRIDTTEFTLNLRDSRTYATAKFTRQQNLRDSRINMTAESIEQQNLCNSRIYATEFIQQNQPEPANLSHYRNI
jgi:hypothetical protein